MYASSQKRRKDMGSAGSSTLNPRQQVRLSLHEDLTINFTVLHSVTNSLSFFLKPAKKRGKAKQTDTVSNCYILLTSYKLFIIGS